MIPRLEALARGLGYRVVWSPELPGSAKGLCRRKQRQIEVLNTIAPNHGVSVLIHEICHALVGQRDELRSVGYALEEIVVESAIFCPGRRRSRLGRWAQPRFKPVRGRRRR